MTGKRLGIAAALVKGVLYIVSLFYSFLLAITRSFNMLVSKRLPCKVISIGNLTLGGTGKTPTVGMLARMTKDDGKNPCVLIRGYGDDEHKMLKAILRDIPIIVGRDRISSGMAACDMGCDTIILDDGFQHWRLKRDIDIVLIDSSNPFGNRRLFPRGILREGIDSLKRADIIMLTKADMQKDDTESLRREIKRIADDIPIIESVHNPSGLYNLSEREEKPLEWIRGKKICSLSSIVNTEYFECILKRLGADIVRGLHYPDHYNYKERDLKSIADECTRLKIDMIVTTEKDAVKLNAIRNMHDAIQIFVLQIELKVTNGKDILRQRVLTLYNG